MSLLAVLAAFATSGGALASGDPIVLSGAPAVGSAAGSASSAAELAAAGGASVSPSALSGTAPPKTPTVLFDGKHHKVTRLPDSLEAAPREAVEEWAGWAEEEGYVMALSDDQRLLFFSSEKSDLGKRLKLIHEAQELSDVLLFGPEDRRSPRPASAPSTEGGGPDGAPRRSGQGSQEPGGTSAQPEPIEPPADSLMELGSEVAIVMELDDQVHMLQVLEKLGHEHAHVKSWLAEAPSHSGFTFETPLVGAWRPVPENEEWDERAELINRVARLMLTREYGPQPFWLSMGFAWNVEEEMLGGIWCYPFRAGFVWATEHTAWPKDLKKSFSDRGDYPLQPDELCEWTPRTYDARSAPLAFGMVHFLAEHHPEDLPGLFDAYHKAWSAGSVLVKDDGTWERKPDFSLPVEEQAKLLVRTTRDDLFEQVTKYFSKKLKYKPR